jgi:hypothetical protein
MVFHIVLFRPRPDLADDDRADLVSALGEALGAIPSIRRFHLGKRVVHGAGYESLMNVSLDYSAVIEFDDLAGLRAYLDHPAHRALGARFMQSLESSAIFDYEVMSADAVGRLSGGSL